MRTFINQKEIELFEKDLNRLLLDFLREDLDLTGAKNGCGIGVCGSCTVLINNQPVRACKTIVKNIIGKSVLTIEGFSNQDGNSHLLHPLQQAFVDCGAIQCGFCTPGMVLTAHAFLLKNSNPSREEIRKALAGNLCRCTGYQQIVDAIQRASIFYQPTIKKGANENDITVKTEN